MITGTQMYCLLMLDNIYNAITLLCIMSFVISAFSTTFYYVFRDDHDMISIVNILRKISFTSIFLLVISLFGVTFLPTTKQMAAIIVLPKVLNNEKVQNIGNEALDLTGNLLQLSNEYLKDLMKQEIKK